VNNEPENHILESEKAIAPTSGKPSVRARLVEKIRSELNIEKWPAIWQPAKSKNKPALRTMEREITKDGNRIVSRVEVGYTQLGTLSTEEQKMLYVLIKLWEEGGKPDTQVFFSTRGLARMLKKKGWGTNVINAITKSLRKLRTVPIEWINSYYDQSKQGAVVVDRRPLTLLGDLRVIERRQDGAVNSSLGYFKFDDHVLNNMQLNYTKPVCIEEFFKLKSEIAQLIYSHIDLMLFDKSKYERRSRELFDDLGLKNHEYTHMYERKRAIEKALKELEGIRLSSGTLRTATIEKTVDGKDYKVAFVKGAAAASIDAISLEKLPEPVPSGVIINDYSQTKNLLARQAEELVLKFYKLFHDVETHESQSKELAQALSLIAQHGLNQAKHVIEFAKDAAATSNYQPQTFGGILHYTSRALADFDRQRRKPSGSSMPTASAKPSTHKTERGMFARGEARLAALTPEQHQAWFAQIQAELRQAHSFLATKEGTAMHDAMIRSRIVRHLDQEPMDLFALDGMTDPEAVRRKLGLQNLAL
jgi:hypothetical protein